MTRCDRQQIAGGALAFDGGSGLFGATRAHIERDHDQRPGGDQLDHRHIEKGVGEKEHAEPQRYRADDSERHCLPRVARGQLA